jgi:hypothetical protein
LTRNDSVLAALADILRTGDTQRLCATPPQVARLPARYTTDRELRARATRKVHWETLSLDSRRRILDPVISPEFE